MNDSVLSTINQIDDVEEMSHTKIKVKKQALQKQVSQLKMQFRKQMNHL